VYQIWLDDMYMKVKLALPVNSNPGMVFPRQHFSDRNEQLRYVGIVPPTLLYCMLRLDVQRLAVSRTS